MRKGLVYAGAGLLVLGVVVFTMGLLGTGQASAAFLNCLNGYPMYPPFGAPSACVSAMNDLALYQGVEALGGVAGLVGFVLLIVGIILQPEGPAPAPMAYYPPPIYGPPPGGIPPQGPQSPPPQP